MRRGKQLRQEIAPGLDYFLSAPQTIARRLQGTDLVVGAVLPHALNVYQGFLTCRPAAEVLEMLERFWEFKELA